jgi:hypothetical protein
MDDGQIEGWKIMLERNVSGFGEQLVDLFISADNSHTRTRS